MLGKITDKLFKIQSVVGVEVLLLPDGQIEYSSVRLSRKKRLIVTESKNSHIRGLADLQGVVDHNTPVCLSLSGRGILHKKVKQASGESGKSLLSVFPNVNLDEFYIQQYTAGQDVIFSMIRRKNFRDILDSFTQASLAVVSVCLGPFSIEKLLPVMELESNSVVISNHQIAFENGHIVEYSFVNQGNQNRSFRIDKDDIHETMLVAYATALQNLITKSPIALDVDELNQSKEELINQKVFKVFGITSLAIFFLVLLVNFVLFNYYNKRYIELSGNYSEYSAFKIEFDSINKKITEREFFLQEAGWMRPSQISFYADQIAESVPPSVVLKEMSVNPLDNGLTRTEKKHVFSFNRIILSGVCNKPTDLNSWIRSIKLMSWIREVEIRNYTYDDKIQRGIFLLEITVK
ncbi:hypothetical protein ACFQ21_18440 [Ohtaekwangia kribbensis]|uniref:Tfp pilus assembly protein PilN n=1 Tax=Ohtaekwangia kribbensis TaxID=688913 RepID=A0ABW3K5L5_9BACT